MKNLKNSRTSGISLVALIVTIIVLIILTAAVIVTFMEGGIIDRAKESVFKSDIRTYQEILAVKRAEEQIKLATGNGEEEELKLIDKTITGEAIKEILPEFKEEEYGELIEVVDGEIVAKKELNEEVLQEKWLIDLGIGTGETPVADVEYNVGDEVTIGEEKFRVLKDNGSTLTLLTEKNITTSAPYIQSTSAPTVVFSSTNYWNTYAESYPLNLNTYESEDIEITDAIEVAKAYARKIAEDVGVAVTGRLLTLEEIEELDGNLDSLSTANCPIWINKDDDGNYLNYWLGSAYNANMVWDLGGGGNNSVCMDSIFTDSIFGVRPVITISESAVN
ncbi:MAG: hypothetical protein E7311_05690 [Clostridiales bacterium]|nr:hypothetical protein [Clostridiales bacterium]